MGRYAILQGVGLESRPTKTDAGSLDQNWPEMWRKWPHLVIQGPSGQLAILPPPSGAGSDGGGTGTEQTEQGIAHNYFAHPNLMCHKALTFRHNRILHWWKMAQNSVDTNPSWQWHPYINEAHLNGNGPDLDSNSNFDFYVINDGANNTLHMFGEDTHELGCSLSLQDGLLWSYTKTGNAITYRNGNWTGQLPFEVQASPKHLFTGMRAFGNPGENDEKFFFPDGRITGIGNGIQGGIDYRLAETSNPADQAQGICDVVEHQGSIYYCSQQAVWANRIGMKGSFIYSAYFDNRQDEWGGDSTFGLANVDTTRGSQAQFNDPQMRVFSKHRGLLYMLQNDGKVFTVDPHGITLLANLKTGISNSPYGSGIKGGSLQETPNSPNPFPVPRAFRPFMISFNDQLHAFLVYEINSSTLQLQTGSPIAKGTTTGVGQGIGWFTSHDGVNWADRTALLKNASASGIITPSGNNVQEVVWNNTTAPFIHSALQNTNYPSGYGDTSPTIPGPELKPSGYRQATGRPTESSSRHQGGLAGGWGDLDRLPIWTSGNMIDAPGTAFNALQIKLDKGTVSGFLYPTLVNYPSGYNYIEPSQLDGTTVPTNLLPVASGGVWGPFGQGAKGWDFTGVAGRHVTGYLNDDDEESNNHTLMLCFSDNPNDSQDQDQVASHFFELNKSSGWRQVNYVHWGGAFCGGYQKVDFYDPEIIIPSGSIDDPNPHIDIDRGWMRTKFKILDWAFWDSVKCRFEYTLDDGLNWHSATIASGSLSPLSTNTKQNDPSGVIGEQHEVWWDYKTDLGNQFRPFVRIRMRAEV